MPALVFTSAGIILHSLVIYLTLCQPALYISETDVSNKFCI